MHETVIAVIGVVVLLVLVLGGLEMGFAMAVAGFCGFSYLRSVDSSISLLAIDVFETLTSYAFTVIPLFILMGQVALNSGIAERLYRSARTFLGHVPGGLAMATIVGAVAFKAICASTIATSATFASVSIPEMDKFGYDRKLSTGVVAGVGTLGNLLPPSGTLIILGMLTEQSIGKLFIAGMLPGLVIAFLFLSVVYLWCRVNPALGPVGERCEWRQRLYSLPQIAWPAIIFILTMGGLLTGVFTPTEAGSVGAAAVIGFVLLKGDLSWKLLIRSVRESCRTACMVLLLIAGSHVFGHFITVGKIPILISEWALTLPVPPFMIVIAVICIYLVGGSIIDDLAFLVLATPIFFPAVVELGYDPIWFCIVLAVTQMIGVIAPPLAVPVFIVKSIANERIGVVFRGAAPFILSMVAVLVLLFLIPGVATYLPTILMR